MRPVYNDELYHFGKLGMKWGHHKVQELKKYNDEYKIKIDKIANSKSAHKADIERAKKVNIGFANRIISHTTRAVVSTIIKDMITGNAKKYPNMSKEEMFKKFTDVGKKVVTEMAIEEANARSVANKYDVKGNRIKGSNKTLFTREQMITGGVKVVNTAVKVYPLIRALGTMRMRQVYKKRKAGEAAFNRWGDRILSDKLPDYSNFIPNVGYSVS